MSYTLTIDAPQDAVLFATRNGTRSSAELGALFVAVHVEKMGYVAEKVDNPFEQFCGIWDENQFAEFQDATRRIVAPGDWQ